MYEVSNLLFNHILSSLTLKLKISVLVTMSSLSSFHVSIHLTGKTIVMSHNLSVKIYQYISNDSGVMALTDFFAKDKKLKNKRS